MLETMAATDMLPGQSHEPASHPLSPGSRLAGRPCLHHLIIYTGSCGADGTAVFNLHLIASGSEMHYLPKAPGQGSENDPSI